jgi:hypothetical protein
MNFDKNRLTPNNGFDKINMVYYCYFVYLRRDSSVQNYFTYHNEQGEGQSWQSIRLKRRNAS